MTDHKPILVLEDDEVDVMTIQRAMKDIRIANPRVILNNGEEGLEYLRDKKKERPGIILCDISMPKMNGIEFLKAIKVDPDLKLIPIVMLTSSKEEQDKVDSYNLGVAGYMVKPVEYIQFMEVVRTINLYWTLSELPYD